MYACNDHKKCLPQASCRSTHRTHRCTVKTLLQGMVYMSNGKKKALKKLVRTHGSKEGEIKLQGSLHVCTRSQGSKEKEIKLQGSLHVCPMLSAIMLFFTGMLNYSCKLVMHLADFQQQSCSNVHMYRNI